MMEKYGNRHHKVQMNTQKIISRTIGFLQKNAPRLQGIYLFGSRAVNEHQDTSDLDIAMLLHPLAAKQMTGLQIFTLQCDLSFELGIQVDLINLRQVNTVMQMEIIHTGELIFCADTYACEEFEMLTDSFILSSA
ncbi:MAG: nucleotidyltransferase domain-containing protein [Desulfobacteraceae bacterium]|nr:nucleotidyltransferase domain-containing protein [Desulfobacteraceae bacterium]